MFPSGHSTVAVSAAVAAVALALHGCRAVAAAVGVAYAGAWAAGHAGRWWHRARPTPWGPRLVLGMRGRASALGGRAVPPRLSPPPVRAVPAARSSALAGAASSPALWLRAVARLVATRWRTVRSPMRRSAAPGPLGVAGGSGPPTLAAMRRPTPWLTRPVTRRA